MYGMNAYTPMPCPSMARHGVARQRCVALVRTQDAAQKKQKKTASHKRHPVPPHCPKGGTGGREGGGEESKTPTSPIRCNCAVSAENYVIAIAECMWVVYGVSRQGMDGQGGGGDVVPYLPNPCKPRNWGKFKIFILYIAIYRRCHVEERHVVSYVTVSR